MLKNYLKIALKVLMRRKFFTFISLFGISFTLMILLLVSAFVDIALSPKAPETQLNRTLFLRRLIMKGGEGNEGSEWWSGPGYRLLDRYMRDIPGVELMSIISHINPVTSFIDEEKVIFSLRRTDGVFWRINEFRFLEGAPFSDEDDRQGNMVAVISATARQKFFSGKSALNKYIETNGQRYQVVGVVENVGVDRSSAHGDIWAPIHTTLTHKHMENLMGGYNAILLADSRGQFNQIRAEFQSRLKHVDFPDPDEYNVLYGELETRLQEYTTQITNVTEDGKLEKKSFFIPVTLTLVAFLLLPVINLVSINASRIIERTSEIGVRKAFGASSSHLVGQFVIENIVLCLIGCALGLLGAYLISLFITNTGYIPDTAFGLNYRIFGYGIVLAAFFGILTGSYPAWRMSRLHPVAALRGDNR